MTDIQMDDLLASLRNLSKTTLQLHKDINDAISKILVIVNQTTLDIGDAHATDTG